MIAVTSLSMFHKNKDFQKECIDSWIQIGLKVISVNHAYDIPYLEKDYSNVEFVPTTKTGEHVFGKPYVRINALIESGLKYSNEIMLINSDIKLINSVPILDRLVNKVLNDEFVFISRHNYNDDPEISSINKYGIDVFLFNAKLASLIKQKGYCMGQPFWDYWIPYKFYSECIKMNHVISRFALHKNHELQWDRKAWIRCTNWFCREFDIEYKGTKDFFEQTYNTFTKNANLI
jgi:hypothetical protein